ncbi:hypothetical protein BABINDRAFT_5811 [Babjeviella inositovora NRRL Y-12698]|uniref:Uncharacterized protein n=1 Tax=Babjeviella inositovora NRRL Y-12698 TaxID=984486 RepID=A0A1E3R0K2_9ASCO|nr:uncharacterized protein BABINDRAFT_5811 [Babjeviella inositovora NRRL Y-12698]ODQ82917.1 hypothetical protein BABINDRAFT_5811 [Babjeviella inositovora NRRL Y-12698]
MLGSSKSLFKQIHACYKSTSPEADTSLPAELVSEIEKYSLRHLEYTPSNLNSLSKLAEEFHTVYDSCILQLSTEAPLRTYREILFTQIMHRLLPVLCLDITQFRDWIDQRVLFSLNSAGMSAELVHMSRQFIVAILSLADPARKESQASLHTAITTMADSIISMYETPDIVINKMAPISSTAAELDERRRTIRLNAYNLAITGDAASYFIDAIEKSDSLLSLLLLSAILKTVYQTKGLRRYNHLLARLVGLLTESEDVEVVSASFSCIIWLSLHRKETKCSLFRHLFLALICTFHRLGSLEGREIEGEARGGALESDMPVLLSLNSEIIGKNEIEKSSKNDLDTTRCHFLTKQIFLLLYGNYPLTFLAIMRNPCESSVFTDTTFMSLTSSDLIHNDALIKKNMASFASGKWDIAAVRSMSQSLFTSAKAHPNMLAYSTIEEEWTDLIAGSNFYAKDDWPESLLGYESTSLKASELFDANKALYLKESSSPTLYRSRSPPTMEVPSEELPFKESRPEENSVPYYEREILIMHNELQFSALRDEISKETEMKLQAIIRSDSYTIRNLRAQLSTGAVASSAIGDLNQALSSVKAKLLQARTSENALLNRNKDLLDKVRSLETQIEGLDIENEALTKSISALKDVLDPKEVCISKLEMGLQGLRKELEAEKEKKLASDGEPGRTRNEVNGSEHQLFKAENENKRLEAHIESLKSEIRGLQKPQNDSESSISRPEKAPLHINKIIQSYELKVQDLHNLNSKYESLIGEKNERILQLSTTRPISIPGGTTHHDSEDRHDRPISIMMDRHQLKSVLGYEIPSPHPPAINYFNQLQNPSMQSRAPILPHMPYQAGHQSSSNSSISNEEHDYMSPARNTSQRPSIVTTGTSGSGEKPINLFRGRGGIQKRNTKVKM